MVSGRVLDGVLEQVVDHLPIGARGAVDDEPGPGIQLECASGCCLERLDAEREQHRGVGGDVRRAAGMTAVAHQPDVSVECSDCALDDRRDTLGGVRPCFDIKGEFLAPEQICPARGRSERGLHLMLVHCVVGGPSARARVAVESKRPREYLPVVAPTRADAESCASGDKHDDGQAPRTGMQIPSTAHSDALRSLLSRGDAHVRHGRAGWSSHVDHARPTAQDPGEMRAGC